MVQIMALFRRRWRVVEGPFLPSAFISKAHVDAWQLQWKHGVMLVVSLAVICNFVLVPPASAAITTSQTANLDAIFGDLNASTPGCVAGVIQGGHLAYVRGFGMANLGEHVRMSPDTVLEIGSLSKQFTAASIFILAHDGEISLDDPVKKYLPEFPTYAEQVTIRELLHHTSGVRDVISLMETSGIPSADAATQQDALAMIDRQSHLNFFPDTEYEYSNSGYVLLAEIVRKVTGKSLPVFEADHIFNPLDMTHTFVATREQPLMQNRARSYARLPTGGYRLDESQWVQIGDGGVNTTVSDFALWIENLEYPSIDGSWLIKDLETRGVLVNGRTISYAGGLFVDHYDGALRISHDGAWQGYRTSFELFPSRHLGVVALCNGADTQPESRVKKIADVFLKKDSLSEEEKSAYFRTKSSKQLAEYRGFYASGDQRQLWRVQVRNGRTIMGPVGDETGDWFEDKLPSSFTNDGITARFGVTNAQPRLEIKPENEVLYHCATLSIADATSQLLGLSSGNYYSSAFQVTWHFVKRGRAIYLEADGANPNRIDTDKEYLVRPLAANVFTAGPYIFLSAKTQFWLFIDRASGIHFVKI